MREMTNKSSEKLKMISRLAYLNLSKKKYLNKKISESIQLLKEYLKKYNYYNIMILILWY